MINKMKAFMIVVSLLIGGIKVVNNPLYQQVNNMNK
jgi:hypothetical protein